MTPEADIFSDKIKAEMENNDKKSIIEDINIVLDDGIKSGGVEIVSFGKIIASGEAEAATAIDDGQFTNPLEDGVAAQDGDAAAGKVSESVIVKNITIYILYLIFY